MTVGDGMSVKQPKRQSLDSARLAAFDTSVKGTDARRQDPFRRTGGGDRRSERKRNHQHPTSVRQTAAVLNSNTANEVPTDLGSRNRDTP